MQSALPARRSFLNFVADHNPFYLLSAASMLLACLLLSNATTWSPIGPRRLLALIVTLNAYEILLVLLGLHLIARRGLVRDGVILLALEALFIVDVGFLNSETYQMSLAQGWLINGGIAALAVAKLGFIFHRLKLPLASPGFLLLVTEMILLLAWPGLLKQLSAAHAGRLAPLALYASWWTAGLLIAALGLVNRFAPILPTTPGVAPARSVGLVFLSLPIISFVAHLGTAHWVYADRFLLPELAPISLGLAVLVTSGTRRFHPDLKALALILVILGIYAASGDEPRLDFTLGSTKITPVLLTLAAAYAVTIYALLFAHALPLLAVGAAVAIVYLFGPSRQVAFDAFAAAWKRLTSAAASLLPRTRGQWGVFALVNAFVLLALGALFSLRAGRNTPADDQRPDTPAAA